MLKHSKKAEIFTHYTDSRKQLFIKTLCDLFNDMANEQTHGLDVDVDTFNAQGITWMLHKMHIRINRMPVKGEEVVLETWPSDSDRLFAIRDFHVLSAAGDELVKLTSQWMVIDLERRRPIRLPESVLRLYHLTEDVVRDLGFDLDPKSVPLEMDQLRRFSATYDNIDFNLHVTHASYVGWVTNSLPYDFLKSHSIKEFEIVFEHEIMPESIVNSKYLIEESGNDAIVWHRVTDEAGEKNHCVARSVWGLSDVHDASV